MRSASSPGQVAFAVLCCIHLLYPSITATDTAEIDLKSANHKSGVVNKFLADATWRRHRELARPRKNKPNKSSPTKKYAEEDRLDFRDGTSKKSIYDKKYFDYLSAELKDSPEVSSGVSLTKRANGRRIRRNINAEEPHRTKRNGIWYVQPVGSYSFMVPHYIQPNDWRLQFNPYDLSYRPNLNNHYLPAVTTRPVVTIPTSSAPPDSGLAGDVGMRGSFDNVPEGQRPFVFDMVVDTSRDTNYQLIKNTGRPRPTVSPAFGQGFPNDINGRLPLVPTTTSRSVPFTRPGTTRTTSFADQTTTTPRPSIQHNSDDDYDWSNLGLSVDDGIGNRLGFGDSDQNSLNTTNSPSGINNSIGSSSGRRAPSKCVWAIANCCSHNSDRIRYYCFEQNQCPGSFWGENVCRRFYQPALREIENYYNV